MRLVFSTCVSVFLVLMNITVIKASRGSSIDQSRVNATCVLTYGEITQPCTRWYRWWSNKFCTRQVKTTGNHSRVGGGMLVAEASWRLGDGGEEQRETRLPRRALYGRKYECTVVHSTATPVPHSSSGSGGYPPTHYASTVDYRHRFKQYFKIFPPETNRFSFNNKFLYLPLSASSKMYIFAFI